ncbi:MAG: ATP-dependent DNA helicase RecG [Candidatus Gracilibacteria bacterium]|jgi:ATP-dependent DNA helicase RecG|nr:ATP-dependent DNA helicase RecG [Candidatus Gracilibacteria bacterium]
MKKFDLKTPIANILSTTKDRIDLLNEMGIFTFGDLLLYYPRDYESQTQIKKIHELRADEKNLLQGVFKEVKQERTKTGKSLVKAIFQDDDGNLLECVWFNQRYLKNTLPLNRKVLVSGKCKLSFGKISMMSPSFEELADSMVHLGRISPIYREHDKLSSDWLRKKIFELLDLRKSFDDVIPEKIIKNEDFLHKDEAVAEIHFPSSDEKLEKAKKTLAFEELFVLQISGLLRKKNHQSKTQGKSKKIPLDADLQKQFFATLPFTLTDGQKVALFEILRDFEGDFPMVRLLEGDVGSGKTVVAFASSLPIIRNSFQVAILAPTEVLANQHFKGVSEFAEKFDKNIRVELLTGSVKGKKRGEILEGLRKGEVDIIIGTHALIQDDVIFHDLGFCIIDEQHRFGVEQREKLFKGAYPHVLQMTATPIPRTLAIVAFGDQDLSVIPELPKGRKTIITKIIKGPTRRNMEQFVRSELDKGRQGFIICPLVEGSDAIVAKSAVEEFERLKKDVFPDLKLALLHGKMNSKEKKQTMDKFSKGEYDILVSTAVVEVGVDIKNATFIIIESAERFGLAQLHQFRGRVGRSDMQSYCFLLVSEDKGASERLKAMEKHSSGFHLAEIDMQLRGAGEIFGLRQSGLPDLKMASLFDARVISLARKYAEEYIDQNDFDDFNEGLKRELKRKKDSSLKRI